VSTVGHDAALRRWRHSDPKPDEAKAVALVTVTSTSLYCGKPGLARGSGYLLALFGNRLLMLRPTRKPDPTAVLLEFTKGSYRITDVERGRLNATFVLSRPYGSVHLRMSRIGGYSVNDQVLDQLTAAAAGAERAATRRPAVPLSTAGDVRVFARMCAAHGPGAEQATAVVEAEVVSAQANKKVLLVTFPDRLLLLDPDAHTHTASAPVAAFARGSTHVVVSEPAGKKVDVGLAGAGQEISLRVHLYDTERVDRLVIDAIRSIGT
jgi:hypothetical protein